VDFDIMYNRGISKEGELVDIGVKHEIVEKSGAWFSYNGIRIGQGRENAKQFIRDNPKVASELEEKIKTHLLNLGSGFVIADDAEESVTQDYI
jgi:recombination protein RecA